MIMLVFFLIVNNYIIRMLKHKIKVDDLAVLLANVGKDGLDLSVGLQSVLAKLSAHSGLLEAAEGIHGGKHVMAIDPEMKNDFQITLQQNFRQKIYQTVPALRACDK